jgi:beta-hydroxylase
MLEFMSVKVCLFAVLLLSAIYMHFRGKVRLKFARQLTDHSTFMAPINSFIYLFSGVPNTPYLNQNLFPELKIFKDNWTIIREEAQRLVNEGHIRISTKNDDIGFNTFYRKGWKRFYLKWYDDFFPSAQGLCPKTIELIKQVPSINAAMFTLLPPGARLGLHRDPYAGSLRYHLGIMTPNSEECRIFVDGIPHAWYDGQDVLFDETYLHHAENNTDQDRLIFFCDVARPMNNRFATSVNRFFSRHIMKHAATQNTETDKLGVLNRVFKYIHWVGEQGKRLKSYNRNLYYGVKYTLVAALVYWLIFG